MTPRKEKMAHLAALAAEAQPSGRVVLDILGAHDPLGVLLALGADDVTARALAEVLPALLLGEQPLCGACGGPLDFPSAVAVLHADRPDAAAALALGCCQACTAEGPAALRRKLMAYLGQIFIGLRSLDPTHKAPEALQ